MSISKANQIQVHYYFSDTSHGFEALVRNECEKELLNLYYEIAKSLDLKILVQSEPPKEGGFIEIWKFLGDNGSQISLIVSVITLLISRIPVENKKLTQLQIENLELDNELKKAELKELHLKSLQEEDLNEELIKKVVEYLAVNYKITWRRSNFYKKVSSYKRINKISTQRLYNDSPIGTDREVQRGQFYNFTLLTDDLPETEPNEVKIDLISPVLKPGKFYWKGFLNKDIINFEMLDNTFKTMIQNGEIPLNNKVVINTLLVQNRKIDEDGHVKVTKYTVKLVIDYDIKGLTIITPEGQKYLDSK
ncbi:hypothetical protein EOD40_04380 [Flavobacterium sufflavum]|uniref:Uncharacterized protein n=1 Tax=Flavobacterium sufflavum TaxID=1921138 RepID=A0A437L0C7_9FLAO|nr:hypothetical protein [Flavobacterium sufflavum]RVT78479.1 hypothetical protein EOD40_04380 [Flavobacterium sufflavum]